MASKEELAAWKADCEAKGTFESCYNVAVDYAQGRGDERTAIQYLRPLCEKGYGLGCFNLGGILIKEKATRREGLRAFQKACEASSARSGTAEENIATAEGCGIADTVAKYLDSDYQKLAGALGLLSVQASFDCGEAKTRVEKLICGDEQAAELDGRLGDSLCLCAGGELPGPEPQG